MYRTILTILLFIAFNLNTHSQVVINEFVSSNTSGLRDEDGDFSDWIELYNPSGNTVNLNGFRINDKPDASGAWVFPSVRVSPQSHLLLFASGKDRKEISSKYKTLIKIGDPWKYLSVTGSMPPNWRMPDFDDTSWQTGPSGFWVRR
jgi:hypothetical protein